MRAEDWIEQASEEERDAMARELVRRGYGNTTFTAPTSAEMLHGAVTLLFASMVDEASGMWSTGLFQRAISSVEWHMSIISSVITCSDVARDDEEPWRDALGEWYAWVRDAEAHTGARTPDDIQRVTEEFQRQCLERAQVAIEAGEGAPAVDMPAIMDSITNEIGLRVPHPATIAEEMDDDSP